ncbi:MAG: Gfo/Idh/MocA family oxidoreductase [Acidobacteriota bacterium]|nr:Gfo/Idh/MocA family oxidoreductase [Acidobacteriota bacterium]
MEISSEEILTGGWELKLKWGLIGCGDIARKRVAPALSNAASSELIAVSRAQPDLAASFAAAFGAERWYAEWHDLLSDDEIDAVYIATPVHLHGEQAIAAAEAGKHVLCEKPMAMNARECDRMIDAAASHSVKLGIAYYRRFYPVVARVKEIIQSGEIGVPVLAQMEAFEWFNPVPGHPRSWLLQKNLAGGGPMFDFGCHRIEVLLNVFGPINEVKALTANTVFNREVEDTASALFRFAGGPTAVLCVSHGTAEAKDTLQIFGSLGSIHVPVLNEGKLRVIKKTGVRDEEHSPASNLHVPLVEDFTKAVLDNREPGVSGETGRTVARIEAEIYRQAIASNNALPD